MTAIVYRQLPDIPHRQYVRRIVGAGVVGIGALARKDNRTW
jgi:hypothetical protein